MRDGMLFSSLDEQQFNSVVGSSRVVTVPEGQMLFIQNQQAKHFFVVVRGLVKLTRIAMDGNEKVIDIIHPPQSFAEAVILSDYDVFPVNAQAVQASRIIAVDATTYLGYLRESSELCLRVMARMGQRMHWLINEIDRLTLHNASYRLMGYLLDQVSGEDQAKVDITKLHLNAPKKVIASQLSIAPETFSRTLKKLAAMKLITNRRDGSIILDDLPEMRRLVALERSDYNVAEEDALGRCPRL